jgi:hypothetical protein
MAFRTGAPVTKSTTVPDRIDTAEIDGLVAWADTRPSVSLVGVKVVSAMQTSPKLKIRPVFIDCLP